MDKKLLKILMDFSMALHTFEEEGGDLSNEEVEDVWTQVTSIIENEKMPRSFKEDLIDFGQMLG